MKTNKKISLLLILSVLTLTLAGCQALQENAEVSLQPGSNQQQSDAMAKRFQAPTPQGQSAVDSAIDLAKKNSELFEQVMVLRQENKELIAENARLKDQIDVLEPELKQAKKELNEANDLLIEMRIELNNWKMDILGNREEIRQANIAQMEILLKIAEAMGAEVAAKNEQDKQSSGTSGEPNE